MISSDMEEVIGVSDRIAVMHEGRDQRLPRARASSASRTCCSSPSASSRQLSGGRAMLKKDLGLLLLILVVGAVVGVINPRFLSPINLVNTANLIGLFGLFSIGEGFVIITGGIELSVGSMIALLGVIFVDLHRQPRRALAARAASSSLAVGVLIGAVHGLLITKLQACSPSSSRCAAC